MIQDFFKMRYDTLPIAVSRRDWDEPLREKTATFRHNHKEMEMVLVLKGRGKVHIGDAVYPIEQGDAFFVSPYDLHFTEVEKGDIYINRCICFDLKVLGDADFTESMESGSGKITSVIRRDETVNEHLRSIYEATEKKGEAAYLEAAGHLFLLFAYLRKNGFTETASIGKEAMFSKAVLAFLNENYGKDISSAHAAKALYRSQGHFCRSFRQSFGESFSLYLRRYRLERAKEKLLTSSLSVSEIAMESGFSDAAYFAKTFRETFGVTPRTYRKNKKRTPSNY